MQHIIVRVAGLLILQLAVVGNAQETTPTVSQSGITAPSVKNAVPESSQSQTVSSGGKPANGTTTQSGGAGGTGDPAFRGERHPLYRLTKSDVVDASFTFSPDYNQLLTVQPDGFVILKGGGSVFAEGLTLPELDQAVTDRYSRFLHHPEITLTLKDFDKPYFLASGEVAKPGKYELRGDTTVNEAIAMAGGLTQQALHSQVVVFRRFSPDTVETHVLDVKKMLNARDLTEDMHLRAGDFVYVPQSRISKIRKFIPANALSWYMNPLLF
jgi:polysaccharide export outer membrane protein